MTIMYIYTVSLWLPSENCSIIVHHWCKVWFSLFPVLLGNVMNRYSPVSFPALPLPDKTRGHSILNLAVQKSDNTPRPLS